MAGAAIEGRCFAARLRQYAGQPALVTEAGEIFSYDELADRAESFATRLGSRQRLLLIEALNEPEAIIAYLAGLAGGHSVLMAAAASPGLLETFRPDAIYRKASGTWALELAEAEGGLHPDLALLLSTSGTTGATKLVRLSAAAVDANAASIVEYLGIGPGERALTTLPIHYSYGLSVVNSHLMAGGTLLLTSRSITEPALWQQLEEQGATSVAGVPYTYDLLDRMYFWEKPHPTLRTMTQAGGRLGPPDRVARIANWAAARGVRFFVMYGQTEATARMAYMPPELLAANPGAIGVAIPGGSFRLVDGDGKSITDSNAEGELAYTGANVMMGYGESRADLARGPEITELLTGDLAVRDAAGLYRITGRTKRICKPYGLRVSLDELEAMLAREGVKACIAGNDEIVTVLVPAGAPAGLAGDLAARLKLPETLFDIAPTAEPPLLPSGKVDYGAILAAAVARRGKPAVAAQAAVQGEGAVLAIFRRQFPARKVTPESDFLSMGGDSLSYVQVSLALEEVLGELPANWERKSIGELWSARRQGKAESSFFRRIDSDILLRAIALIAVIINHASDLPVGGGADLMLLLAGYSLARFQFGKFAAGQGGAVLLDFFVKIILPYFAVMAVYQLLRKPVPVTQWLLIDNFFGLGNGLLEPFWFIEALFQLYLIIFLLFLMPWVRRMAGADPWRFAVSLMALAWAVRLASLHVSPDGAHLNLNRAPDSTFLLFAIGWGLWFARTGRQRMLMLVNAGLLVVCTLGVIPGASLWQGVSREVGYIHGLWLTAGLLIMLYLPRVPLPNILHAAVGAISGAGYYIYLVHGVVVYVALQKFPGTPLVVTVALSLLAGIAAGWALNAIARRLMRGRSTGPS